MVSTVRIKKIIDGFTYIELAIVVAIIGLVSSFTLVSYMGQLDKARDSSRKVDVNRIQKMMEEYEKDHSCYPRVSQWPDCGNSDGTIFENYIGTIPCDPDTNNSYVYDSEAITCPSWYTIYADLENNGDYSSEELGCTGSICGPTAVGGFDYYVSSPNAPLPENVAISPTHGGQATATPTPVSGMATASPTFTPPPSPGSTSIPTSTLAPTPTLEPTSTNTLTPTSVSLFTPTPVPSLTPVPGTYIIGGSVRYVVDQGLVRVPYAEVFLVQDDIGYVVDTATASRSGYFRGLSAAYGYVYTLVACGTGRSYMLVGHITFVGGVGVYPGSRLHYMNIYTSIAQECPY